jgi:hypothetical protein
MSVPMMGTFTHTGWLVESRVVTGSNLMIAHYEGDVCTDSSWYGTQWYTYRRLRVI